MTFNQPAKASEEEALKDVKIPHTSGINERHVKVSNAFAATVSEECASFPLAIRVTLTRGACALILGRMENVTDITLSITVPGIAMAGNCETVSAGAASVVPIRVLVSPHQKVSEYLNAVRQQEAYADSIRLAGEERTGSMLGSLQLNRLNTLLIVECHEPDNALEEMQNGNRLWPATEFSLAIRVYLGSKKISFAASFDDSVIGQWDVNNLLRRFDTVMRQLGEASPECVLADISTTTVQELSQIWKWNSKVPEKVESCIHEIFEEKAQAQPNAPAICAWDGELTYGKLNQLATALAASLVAFGIKPNELVPLCFEKSMWTTVAMLGVAKAGGCFVLLDPSLPKQRLRNIVDQVKSRLIISSVSSQELSSSFAQRTITLNWSFFTKRENTQGQTAVPVDPSNLLYIVFTSGSTGTPKGVMITHTNTASALYHQSKVLKLTAESRIYDFASYNFDVSINNAWTALAAGGCLCVPSDPDRRNNLEESISALRANIIDITPSAAKVLSPTRLPALRMIIFGGEALYATDIERWWRKAVVIQIYGPCECTPTATINLDGASPTDLLPIGRGVGLLTWVVNPEDHDDLVAPGDIGELLLEGPLVGNGYLNDPGKTELSFIESPKWLLRGSPDQPGRRGRLYKTGDLVRYSEDGKLKFIRRKDTQIKIRGQRVELGEIEHAIRSHSHVEEAVAVLQYKSEQEASIASFVTIRDVDDDVGASANNSEELELVETWKDQFETEYNPINDIQPEEIGKDYMGWTSMYDGRDIDKSEMQEWLDDTMTTITNGGQPDHVVEIGTGSGMILFNLASGLQSYIGLEPSRRASEFVTNTAKTIPTLSDKVKIFTATAADLDLLSTTVPPNLAILNSVVQYFPTLEYLFRVIRDLVELNDVETIFIGDIRSYAVQQQFLAMKALHVAGAKADEIEMRRIIADMDKAESELLIDPGFFTTLPSRLPGKIGHVEVLPKVMHATNELSSYRYAVVLHINTRRQRQQHQQHIHEVGKDVWVDFVGHKLDRRLIAKLLQSTSAPVIAISNITHSKTLLERQIVDTLSSRKTKTRSNTGWLLDARESAQRTPSLAATDLIELARDVGYRVEISCARQYSQKGAIDAIFHRYEPTNGQGRVLFQFPADHHARPYHSFGSHPLRSKLRHKIQQELHELLLTKLPSYMIPQHIIMLDTMPVTENGKIDRRVLVNTLPTPAATRLPGRQATSETEQQIQNIWGQVMGITPDSIGLNDSFFQLGGNSIAAMRVVSEARKAGIKLAVSDIFRHPVLHDLAKKSRHIPDGALEEVAPYSLLNYSGDITLFLQDIAGHYRLRLANIRDVYPCTPLQEGIIALSLKRPGDYVMQTVLELSPNVVIEQFCAAWEDVTRALSILRTRIVQQMDIGLVQVVLDEPIHWITAAGLDSYLNTDKKQSMDLGEPLTRYALVKDVAGTPRWYVWTMHHALFDGWSHHVILDAVYRRYRGESIDSGTPFQSFIKYIKTQGEQKMTKYWLDALSGCDAIPFPSLLPTINQPIADKVIQYKAPQLHQRSKDITASTLIRAAWAILASQMTNSADVVFGATVSGRNAAVAGIDTISGPTFATVPVRVKVNGSQTVSEYLSIIQMQATDMMAFEQAGLHRIASISSHCRRACQFQTLLVVQPLESSSHEAREILGSWQSTNKPWLHTYALVLEAQLGAQDLTLKASFDSNIIQPWIVDSLLARLDMVIQKLNNATPSMMLTDVGTLTPQDLEQIRQWNSFVPTPVEERVHDMIQKHVKSQPTSPAVFAWDGEITYQELDQLTTILADRLIDLGVQSGTLVPLCFEKSMWTTVAIVGVLKAGGAFVLLDPTLPEQRLQATIRQVEAKLLLTSSTNQALALRLLDDIYVINSDFFKPSNNGRQPRRHVHQPSTPSSIIYAVFTSGSTGTPKGVLVTHKNFASALHHQSRLLSFTSASRVLDFSSYAFDTSINNAFRALTSGGCLCVPSDQDRRNNLADCINLLRANVAELTPSIAQILDPKDLPGLKSIIFGGEAVREQDTRQWWGHADIFNAYGPAECTPVTVIKSNASTMTEATHIGRGVGVVTWVVDPDDHNSLLAPGCIGELLLEGPLVGPGYLNDPVKTAAAYIEGPKWLHCGVRGRSGRHGRVYKTGDLVKYNQDGTLVYMGRKDAQVKIRGQRVELGEVEYRIKESMPEARQVVAELVLLKGEIPSPVLTTFISTDIGVTPPEDTHSIKPEIFLIAPAIRERLTRHLPSYMVPTVFFSMSRLPVNTTGKTDRRRLRELGASFSFAQLAELQTVGEEIKQQPVTEVERHLQEVWAKVLHLNPASIGIHDSFFSLGGDSITAIKIVAAARKHKIQLTVSDIFKYPTLKEIAQLKPLQVNESNHEMRSSATIERAAKAALLAEIDFLGINIGSIDVAEILPLSDVQEESIVTGIFNPRRFCKYFHLDIVNVDVPRLQRSCSLTLERFDILRACFLPLLRRFWQVVLRHRDQTIRVTDIEGGIDIDQAFGNFCRQDVQNISTTQPQAAFFMLRYGVTGMRLVLRVSHAQYDGISLSAIFHSLVHGYKHETLSQPLCFSTYLAYTRHYLQRSMLYWKELLRGSRLTKAQSKLAVGVVRTGTPKRVKVDADVSLPQLPGNITLATVICSSWAILLSQITGETDIVYGRLVAGRNHAIEGIEDLVGPCANVVPVRVRLPGLETAASLFSHVQEQFVSLGDADSLGFQNVVENCTDWPAGSILDSYIQHQNHDENPEFHFTETASRLQAFEDPTMIPQCLYMVSRPHGGYVKIEIQSSTHIMTERAANKLLYNFCRIMESLVANCEVPLQLCLAGHQESDY